MHYLDMLTRQFNKELLADQQQIELYPHTFSDEDRLPQLVQTLLHELEDEIPVVQNHVLVLFETTGYQLSHIRAVSYTHLLFFYLIFAISQKSCIVDLFPPICPEVRKLL